MSDYIDVSQPFRVLPEFKERVWGVEDLDQWFPEAPSKIIGEAWFTAADNKTGTGLTLSQLVKRYPEILGNAGDPEHPELIPLLVKLLFTTSRLSVQVHPKDEYAYIHHGSLGKTEAWFVIEAKPGAEVALGFKEEISSERLRQTAESGAIESLLDWRPVTAGDIIFVPAGTVHAIGAGLTICEIQQNSDITYRLYDYGRPRELHLDHGCVVSDLGPYYHHFTPEELSQGRSLIACSDYFRIERLEHTSGKVVLRGGSPHYILLISIRGEGTINGESFGKGQVWVVPAGSVPVSIAGPGSEWLMTYGGTEEPPEVTAA